MNIFKYTKLNSNIMNIANIYGIKEKDVCPFHKDTDPSFSISEDKQIFKCFGCDVSGDVIDLVAQLEGTNKIDACKRILSLNNLEYKPSKESITKFRRKSSLNRKLDKLYWDMYKHVVKKIKRLRNLFEAYNSYNAIKYISELEMILDFLDDTDKKDKESLVFIKGKLERMDKEWKKIDLTR